MTDAEYLPDAAKSVDKVSLGVAATTGVAKVPSPLKKVVVLFGGVGTHPPTVAVIVATLPVAIGVENVCTHVKV